MYCPKCGQQQVSDNTRFCSRCGLPIDVLAEWLAGGGVKPGFSLGATDDFGHLAVKDKVHMHDLHATILHLLGMDHELSLIHI